VIKKDRAQFTRMMIEKGIISEDGGTSAQTLAVMLQTEVERQIAASMTRAVVDAQRTEDHLETEMPQDELIPETRTDRYPDGVVHTEPAHPVETDDNSNDPKADPEGWMPKPGPDSPSRYEYYDTTLEEFRAGLGLIDHPSTEFVLNFHGWYSPENGGLPIYVGRPKDIEQIPQGLQPPNPENGTSAV
jgi:hypothetical protein